MSRAAVYILLVLASRSPAVAQQLTDVAPLLGIAGSPGDIGSGLGGGVSWADLDGDGDLDLVFTAPSQPPLLYWNQGGDYAVDESSLEPPMPPGSANGHLCFDMEGDGDLDVLLLRQGTNLLFENLGGTAFKDVSATRLPATERWTVSAAPGDFDGDGDTDLLVANYISGISFPAHDCEPNELWVNDGEGRFTDRAAEFGIVGRGCSLAAAMSDIDGDGDLDLLVANDFGVFGRANELYRNDGPLPGGGWAFTDVSEASGFDARLYAMGFAITDVDDDGRLDVYATSIGRQALLLGAPDGTFADATDAFGLSVTFADTGYQLTWGAAIEDLDGDGWLDLFAAGGHIPAAPFIANPEVMPNLVMAGTPSHHFVEKPPGWTVLDAPQNHARGVSAGDFDGDGRPDLAVGHATGQLSVYRNESAGPPPLRVRLVPTLTGRVAVGARVSATCGGLTRVRELTGGATLGGAHEPVLRFTFPGECNVPGLPVALVVRWPSGYVQAGTSATSGELGLTEPAWLVVQDATVLVTPTSPEGAPLGPEAAVVISADGAQMGATVPGPPGTWHADLGPHVGDVVLSVSVGGATLPVHPRLPAADAQAGLWLSPQHVIAGQPFTAVTVPRAPGGALLGDGLDVAIQGPDGPVAALPDGDGAYRAALVAPGSPGAVPLGVLVGGQPHGDTLIVAVEPPFDASLSHVKISPLYLMADQSGIALMHVFMRLVDANGRPYQGDDDEIGVQIDGVPIQPVNVQNSGAERLFTFLSEPFTDGATVTFLVAGLPAAPTEVMHLLPAPSQAAAFIDPVRTHCATSMAALRADGADVLTAFMFIQDTFGNPVPLWGVTPTPVLEGMTLVPGSLKVFEEYVQLEVRAGTTPGTGTLHVTAGGPPVGPSCTVSLLPATLPEALSEPESSLTITTGGLMAGDGTSANVRFQPRTPLGRLAGSGLDVTFTTSLGSFEGPPVYEGLGRYEATLLPGVVPGTATVTATVLSPPLTITETVEIAAPPWWPPDTEAPDAEPDASEEVADVALPEAIDDVPEVEEAEPEPEPADDVAAQEPEPDVPEDVVEPPTEDTVVTAEVIDVAEPRPDVARVTDGSEGDAESVTLEAGPEPAAPDTTLTPAPRPAAGGGCSSSPGRTPTGAQLLLLALALLGRRRTGGAYRQPEA